MPRDVTVLQAVYEYRVLSRNQIERLCFGTVHPYIAQRRIALLYHHGFLERQFLPARGGIIQSHTLYLLGERGAVLLATSGLYEHISWSQEQLKVGTYFLSHMLGISEFRVRFTLACQQQGIPIAKWIGERDLKAQYDRVTIQTSSGKEQLIPIIPDSYFVVQTPQGNQCFALEYDTGSMPGKRIKTKVAGYLAYIRSKAYQKRFGTNSLRVLFIASSERRMRGLMNFTQAAGGKRRFWFATLDSLDPERLLTDPIWQTAGENTYLSLLSASA